MAGGDNANKGRRPGGIMAIIVGAAVVLLVVGAIHCRLALTGETMSLHNGGQRALLRVYTKPFELRAQLKVTPAGLLAIAALVSAILLSTSVVVQAARK